MGLFAKYKTDRSTESTPGPTIRTEKTLRLSKPSSRRESPVPRVASALSSGSSAPERDRSRLAGPRRIIRRSAPTKPTLESDSSSDDEGSEGRASKRRRLSEDTPSTASSVPKRELWAGGQQQAGSVEKEMSAPGYIPGSEIATIKKPKMYSRVFPESDQAITVSLQYPGLEAEETYELVRPLNKDDFNPFDEIIHNIRCMATYLFRSEDLRKQVLNEDSGLMDSLGVVRKMRRSTAIRNEADYRESLESFNSLVRQMREDGSFEKTVQQMEHMPLAVVERILTQVYSRTVSLEVEKLRAYENGTDFVYGELLAGFVSSIFKETALRSDQVIVDLGSGVGNVVLQAALEIGCESWGCEIMQKASELAVQQEKEFQARCRLWGFSHGTTHLRSADFLSDVETSKALRRADLVLVNNQAFTPALNDGLVNLFLDLKEGCRIVSLKPFVTPDHKITKRNYNSPINLLRVTKRFYGSDSVSWTSAPGEYYISVKDSRMLKRFAKANGLNSSETTVLASNGVQ